MTHHVVRESCQNLVVKILLFLFYIRFLISWLSNRCSVFDLGGARTYRKYIKTQISIMLHLRKRNLQNFNFYKVISWILRCSSISQDSITS